MRVTAETKEATRQAILTAAVEQFRKTGFDVATTREIARAAKLGVGTLFNYFPTKESIVAELIADACERGEAVFAGSAISNEQQVCDELSLEENLFAHVAAILRKLRPHRKYLHSALETALSPLSNSAASLRTRHLETVSQIAARHGCLDVLSPVGLQLYWTLYTGVLVFWSHDNSPRQDDTLALLDQSIAMFVGWLRQDDRPESQSK